MCGAQPVSIDQSRIGLIVRWMTFHFLGAFPSVVCYKNVVETYYYLMYLLRNLLWKSLRMVSLINLLPTTGSSRDWFRKTTSSSHRRFVLKSPAPPEAKSNNGLPDAISSSCASRLARASFSALILASSARSALIRSSSAKRAAVSSVMKSIESDGSVGLVAIVVVSQTTRVSLARYIYT